MKRSARTTTTFTLGSSVSATAPKLENYPTNNLLYRLIEPDTNIAEALASGTGGKQTLIIAREDTTGTVSIRQHCTHSTPTTDGPQSAVPSSRLNGHRGVDTNRKRTDVDRLRIKRRQKSDLLE